MYIFILIIISFALALIGFLLIKRSQVIFRKRRHIASIDFEQIDGIDAKMSKIAGETWIKEPLKSPVTKTDCVWWHWLIEKDLDMPKSKKNAKDKIKLRSRRSEDFFFVDDSTGKAVIDPDNAEITTENTFSATVSKTGQLNDSARKFLLSAGISPDDIYEGQQLILTERVIPLGGSIKVLGSASYTYPKEKYGLDDKLPLFKKNSRNGTLMITNKKGFELSEDQASEAVKSIVIAISVIVVSVVLLTFSIISMF